MDAILLKLLVHEQGFTTAKDEGSNGGSECAVAYAAQRKVWNREEPRQGGEPWEGAHVLQLRRFWPHSPEM